MSSTNEVSRKLTRERLRGALSQNKLALCGFLLLVIFLLAAITAPWLAPHDPAKLDLGARLLTPSPGHWFGTDELGRDVFSRTLYGARVSLTVAFAVVAVSLLLGLAFGMAAGFYGGWIDTVINVYLTNAFLSLPGILLAVAFVAFLGPSLIKPDRRAGPGGMGELRAPGAGAGHQHEGARGLCRRRGPWELRTCD